MKAYFFVWRGIDFCLRFAKMLSVLEQKEGEKDEVSWGTYMSILFSENRPVSQGWVSNIAKNLA